jgi:hypothetical protein
MPTLNLLYRRKYDINDDIQIVIPTVGEIIDDEDAYYGLVSLLTAMPIDMMVPLSDAGVDFTKINDYELFLMLFPGVKTQDTHLVFGDLDLTKFELATNSKNDTVVLWNQETDVVIDRSIHGQIASTLRKIHHLEKNLRKPANEESKKYMLQRARDKQRRHKNRTTESQLESLIVAMVNSEKYKYDFEGTRELSIYQFNESVRQIINLVDYQNRMIGVYTGNIDSKHLSQDDLNWLTHK